VSKHTSARGAGRAAETPCDAETGSWRRRDTAAVGFQAELGVHCVDIAPPAQLDLESHVTNQAVAAPNKLDPAVLKIAGVVVLGAIMSILDITVVSVALPTFQTEFNATYAEVAWTMTGYTLALATVIPLSGWAANRFGTKRLYMLALLLFTLGSRGSFHGCALAGLGEVGEDPVLLFVIEIGQFVQVAVIGHFQYAVGHAILYFVDLLRIQLGRQFGEISCMQLRYFRVYVLLDDLSKRINGVFVLIGWVFQLFQAVVPVRVNGIQGAVLTCDDGTNAEKGGGIRQAEGGYDLSRTFCYDAGIGGVFV